MLTRVSGFSEVRGTRNLTIVKECSAIGEIAVLTGRVGHLPRMDDVASNIDQVHRLVVRYQRSKQREPRGSAVRIIAAEADPSALYGVWFNF
jgi:hypothetical protein